MRPNEVDVGVSPRLLVLYLSCWFCGLSLPTAGGALKLAFAELISFFGSAFRALHCLASSVAFGDGVLDGFGGAYSNGDWGYYIAGYAESV